MRIGFVGLGVMGRPIATHLARAGHDLLGFTRRPETDAPVEGGGRLTPRLSDFADREVVFLCLSDGRSVEEVLVGAGGLAPVLAAGTVVVDLTTHDRTVAVVMAGRLADREIAYVDAPISGMRRRAEDGTLTVMCGGAAAVVEPLMPVFRTFAGAVLPMGDVGTGQSAKLFNQLLFDINTAALAELMPAAVALGLDPEKVAEVVNTGTGRSYASEFFLPRILEDRFTDGYPLAKAYKDLRAGAAMSADLGLPMPVLGAATATYQTALRMGFGDLDKGAMIRVYEALSGRTFRSAGSPAPTPDAAGTLGQT